MSRRRGDALLLRRVVAATLAVLQCSALLVQGREAAAAAAVSVSVMSTLVSSSTSISSSMFVTNPGLSTPLPPLTLRPVPPPPASAPPPPAPLPAPVALALSAAPASAAAAAAAARLQRRDIEDPETLKQRSSKHCDLFTEGEPDKNKFFSPLFGSNYPNSTDCYRILDAGRGNTVALDFRESFHLEKADNCDYDYLEIRDGGHGYDPLLAKYCGDEFPLNVTSRGRYLWLHFHSDENIEYSGFAAVFQFVPKPTKGIEPPEEECSLQRNGSEGFIQNTDIPKYFLERSQSYGSPIDCMWVIRVEDGWRIQLSFQQFQLDKPNDCQANFVDVFKARTDIPARLRLFCGAAAETVESDTNLMHIRFYTDAKANGSKFEALFTAFRDGNTESCRSDEFDCQDNTCISRGLRCNGRTNCRQLWDEDPGECDANKKTIWDIIGTDHIIIILVIFCLILSGMCFAFVYNCVRKLVHDHKIIKEQIRQSRENRLDEVGKTPPLMTSPRVGGAPASRGGSAGPAAAAAGGGAGAGAEERAAERDSSPRRSGPEDCYVPGAGDLLPILLGAGRAASAEAGRPVPANGDVVFVRDGSGGGGGHAHHHYGDDECDDVELSTFPPPEMRDNECQTRESLFLNTSSDHSATPPPPPPPLAPRCGSLAASAPTAPPPPHHAPPAPASGFSTFGYGARERAGAKECATMPHQHHHHHHHHQSPPQQLPPRQPLPPQFRAEAVIEMEQQQQQQQQQQQAAGAGPAPPPPPQRPFSVQSTKSAPDVIVTH